MKKRNDLVMQHGNIDSYRGGCRSGSGRKPKDPEAGARIKRMLTLSPANLAYLESLKIDGDSTADALNRVLDSVRGSQQ